MSTPIHCDKCDRDAPPLEQARKEGWYLSTKLSVSGIPWDLICPECFYAPPLPANGDTAHPSL